jgi:hypothetical protein
MIFKYFSRQLRKFEPITSHADHACRVIRAPAAVRTLLLGLAMSLLMGSLLALTSP